MNKVKLEIRNRWTGTVLFEYEKEENTLKDTVEKAVEEGANLEGANLRGANLELANLRGAYLEGANLRGANLEGANLELANLEGAYLEGADLKGANLEGANLELANLEGAYLEGADLKGANLEGANLELANLEGADLEGAYLYVSDNDIDANEVITEVKNNSNLEIKETYINKNIIPTRWSCFWKNGLIICDWNVKEPKKEIKKMTVSEICKELGYDIEIVKEGE